jgi:two-component system nitrogen regulation response regulator NtrX
MRAPMVDAMQGTVLVIDDDPSIRKTCVGLLRARGLQAIAASTVSEGLRLFAQHLPAAVLLDLKLPDGTGNDVLRELQRQSPGTPVVVVSGYGKVGEAVDAMRAGAADYIEKPVSREKLLPVLERVLGAGQAGERAPGLDEAARFGMVGRSEAMRRIFQLVDMAAPTRCRVFVSGESGTGKELIARAVHNLSARRERPFVQLNCAAIPAELIESEMFGHLRGAFTGAVADRRGLFEAADGGTLFLDEIGDMSPMTQSKLLRVLQENQLTPVGSTESRPVDVRIVSATSKNLPEEIARGAFREDLYHRINVLTIAVPPLRARREDIPLLADHFLRLAVAENDLPPRRLSPRAMDLLGQLPWPGNVRELRNLMERIAVLVAHENVSHEDVMAALQMPLIGGEGEAVPLREARARFERQYILSRLTANRGSLGDTARDLGIERTNLYRKMRQLGIGSSKGRRT